MGRRGRTRVTATTWRRKPAQRLGAALLLPAAAAGALTAAAAHDEAPPVVVGLGHATLTVYICGEEIRPVTVREPRRTVGQLAGAVGVALRDNRVRLPDGRSYDEDDGCHGLPPACGWPHGTVLTTTIRRCSRSC